ncbi:hypothetical protein [Anaplasma ovis]|uniref:hypothetical protein n=1 Tax=Anaplasma ovis TaxID=142058 RepID=UPI000E3CA6CF|nr:hypothetical protein [Anaplasma ovis]
MTKSEAKKWGTAVEGATGGGDVSQKVCGTAGSGTNKCGTADSQNTNGKLSTAFTDAATLLSAENNISTSGMAILVYAHSNLWGKWGGQGACVMTNVAGMAIR